MMFAVGWWGVVVKRGGGSLLPRAVYIELAIVADCIIFLADLLDFISFSFMARSPVHLPIEYFRSNHGLLFDFFSYL